ncbi:Uma2 family endonuclease [Kitasatospora sp. NPDC096128]|uniref:Uma2 family endonuclease n=1 Tax=Kitasatospora sp. NPDC096128 TaxID=3155547 RepID=UPI00332BD986
MDELPDWMYAPRIEGWFAADLDHLPQAPPHTELLHGALVFRLAPQRSWHDRVARRPATALEAQAPDGLLVESRMSVTLDERNRLEPDVVLAQAAFEPDRAGYTPGEVLLVVEVVSPESECRDHGVKFGKYAEAGIPHYWIVEQEDGRPVVHIHELDRVAHAYAPGRIFRGTLNRPVPFPIFVDLNALAD